jgi:hypothetical protein
MVIEQIVRDDNNNIIAKKVAFDFEGAEENLGKLERYYDEAMKEQECIMQGWRKTDSLITDFSN